jgi:hypothetical protein
VSEKGSVYYARSIGTQLDHNAIEEIRIMISSLFEHDLFGKPVSTFPDHALAIRTRRGRVDAKVGTGFSEKISIKARPGFEAKAIVLQSFS